MDLIHAKSAPAVKSEVQGLISVPNTQEDIKSGHWEVIGPTQSLTGATSIELSASSGAFCTDLSASFVRVDFTVTKTGGSIVAADACSLTNLAAHSLFSKINLYVNDVKVSSCDRYYPYTAALLTLTGKSSSWADSGQMEGFYKDTAGQMDDYAAANAGFVARKALIVAGAVGTAAPVVSVTFRPYLGAFAQTKLIPDRTELTLQMERSDDKFALIYNNVAGSTITMTRVKWYVRRVALQDDARDALSALLLKEHALYPIDRVRCTQKTFKTASFEFPKLLSGAIPTHLIIGFVSSSAAQGQANQNPLNFANMGLTTLQVNAGGFNFPRKEYKPRFNANMLTGAVVSREYHALMMLALKSFSSEGLMFSMADFCGGYALYGFDLTPDLDSGHWSPSYRGDIDVHGDFAAQPAADVTLVLLSLTPGVFEISGDREIFKDW